MPPKSLSKGRKVKPLYEFVVASPKGAVLGRGSTESDAWFSVTHPIHWETLKEEGYRCIRVLISPI
jgi:hypothetical protein